MDWKNWKMKHMKNGMKEKWVGNEIIVIRMSRNWNEWKLKQMKICTLESKTRVKPPSHLRSKMWNTLILIQPYISVLLNSLLVDFRLLLFVRLTTSLLQLTATMPKCNMYSSTWDYKYVVDPIYVCRIWYFMPAGLGLIF